MLNKQVITVHFRFIVFFFKQATVQYYDEHGQQYMEYNPPVNDIVLKLDESFMVSHEKNEDEKNEESNRWKVTVDQDQVKSSYIVRH